MAIIGEPLSVLALKAKIHVTTMPGASVTFKHGSISATKTANSSGVCDYEVRVPDFGSWSITASSGHASGTNSVNVTAVTQYNVAVVLRLWIIQNGNVVSGFSQNGVGNHHFYDDMGDYIEMKTYQGGSNEKDSWYYNPPVSFGYWKTLVVDTASVGDPAYAGVSSNNSSNPPSFVTSVKLNNRTDEWSSSTASRHTSNLNVSSVAGSRYIAFTAQAWINSEVIPVRGTGGVIRIWNAYLTG